MPRARLLATLRDAREAALALVQAPAGSGKTTLLTEWHAAEPERRFAWLSLDRADNDPVRFLEGAIAALRTVAPAAGVQALAHLGGPASPMDVVLPSLVNDLAGEEGGVVLVLDDYHVIADPRVHEAVTFLLDRRPATLQLAIATRAEPPLPIGRLRVRGELAEVRAADLRFTDGEAAALLNDALALGLDADDVARLQRRTEGWAAGLRLAALSLAGREDRRAFISSFAGDDRPVVDYLGFEVLDGQPPQVREFLLETSILDRLCGPLCDRVTEGEGSAAMLDALERGGLLVLPLDTRREWYRYHHLLAGLLRNELARTRPEAVATLHRRAADWFRSAGAAGCSCSRSTRAASGTATTISSPGSCATSSRARGPRASPRCTGGRRTGSGRPARRAPPSATRSRAATSPARASSSPSTGTRTSSAGASRPSRAGWTRSATRPCAARRACA